MSKKPETKSSKPNTVFTYSVNTRNGAFVPVRIEVDPTTKKVIGISELSPEDVLPVVLQVINNSIRKDLGL